GPRAAGRRPPLQPGAQAGRARARDVRGRGRALAGPALSPRLGNGPGISKTKIRRRRSALRPQGDPVNLELTGKTALVTGGSQGIGRAIAFGLGAEGATVASCARDTSRLEQTAQESKAKSNAKVLMVPSHRS